MNVQVLIFAVANSMKNIRRGFTLIELLIYIGLFVIFVTGSIMFAWNAILSAEKANVQDEVIENLRLASQRLAFEIRNASGINSVTSSSISLSNTDSLRNPTVFDVSGGRLRVGFGLAGSCPTTSPCFLTDNKVRVTSLVFENLSVTGLSKNIRFTISIDSNGGKSEWQKSGSYSESIEIRSR